MDGAVPGAWRVEWFDEVTSTQDLAWARLEADGPGAVVAAHAQTSGRGRTGRQWQARRGQALLCSLALRPRTGTLTVLGLVAAVALVECLATFGVRCQLKWPNDVLLDGRKLAGLLVESRATGAVLGIGLNIADPGPLADPRALPATGLPQPIPAEVLLANLLPALGRRLVRLDAGDCQLDDWRSCATTLGKRVQVAGLDRPLEGVAIDIDDVGCLLVRDGAGVVHQVAAGDIRVR